MSARVPVLRPLYLTEGEVEPASDHLEVARPVVRVDLGDAVEEHARGPAKDEHIPYHKGTARPL